MHEDPGSDTMKSSSSRYMIVRKIVQVADYEYEKWDFELSGEQKLERQLCLTHTYVYQNVYVRTSLIWVWVYGFTLGVGLTYDGPIELSY